MAETGTGPTEIMRRKGGNLTDLCFLLHYAPNNLGTEAGAPNSASFVDRPEQNAIQDSTGRHPCIWVIADLIGKGGHVRTIPVPDWVKSGIGAPLFAGYLQLSTPLARRAADRSPGELQVLRSLACREDS
jgi:hypothetical protein